MDENNQGLPMVPYRAPLHPAGAGAAAVDALLAALTCAMAAWIVLTCFVTQQYTSSTTFSVTTRTSNLYYTNITAAADVAASYSQLLQSRVLRQTMEQDLGMPLNGTGFRPAAGGNQPHPGHRHRRHPPSGPGAAQGRVR